ncbi:hypothetical protein SS1G_14287 [Sclerotinia sclerotiorum 1980 UF-70]|uniref:Helicase ATP-binding domain-containing protein n=1 Tax=Sclerotinia sclerotiorum (strain ATCC 18683 / 1980 / Ss-1) TaxID=665079 RepID=A7F9K6_SCLS1|nr:hypothetical protein SS1G_14287 [Sclerotinia sclerotiorum 1980 UF-70]EDO00417.1 hypothetical protein SS1G_14287 [Sclerotinia sclerotiorum 1980 UF-70]
MKKSNATPPGIYHKTTLDATRLASTTISRAAVKRTFDELNDSPSFPNRAHRQTKLSKQTDFLRPTLKDDSPGTLKASEIDNITVPDYSEYSQRRHLALTPTPTINPLLDLAHPAYQLPRQLTDNFAALGIKSIYPWQSECLLRSGALAGGRNLVYTAPTGGGKSLVADVLMLKKIIQTPEKKAFLEQGVQIVGMSATLDVLPFVDAVDPIIMNRRRDLLSDLRNTSSGLDQVLERTVLMGVAFHRRVILHGARMGSDLVGPSMLRQMRGRAGRKGKDEIGETYLCCEKSDLESVTGLMEAEIPSVESCLVPGKRGMKRQSFLYEATRLEQAVVASSLAPEDGLFVYKELRKSLKTFVLDGEMHALYTFTPVQVVQGNINWQIFRKEVDMLDESNLRVLGFVGLKPLLINKMAHGGSMKESTPEEIETVRVYKRFYTALQLRDLCNEMPVHVVARKYDLPRGTIQNLAQTCHGFAAGMIKFCEKMDWGALAAVLDHFSDRLKAGAKSDLLALADITFIKSRTARIFWDNGYKTVGAIAGADSKE